MHIPSDFAQVTHVFAGDAAPTGAVVTYGIFVEGFTGDADAMAEAAVEAADTTKLCAQLPNGTSIVNTIVKRSPEDGGQIGESSTPVDGVASGDNLPPNCAFLVQKRTSLGGRKNRGRLFVPGVRETVVDDSGVLTSGTVTSYQTALDDWLAALDTALIPMVLLHTSPADTPLVVTSLALSATIATQRKRLRR